MTDRLYCRSGTALCTGAGGRLVVLDFAASEYLLLNGPAALVWHGRQSDGARLDRAAISAHGCRTSLRLPRRDGVRGRWRPRRPQARRDTAPAPASIGRSPPTRVTNAAQPNPAKPARRPGRVRRDCRAAVGRSRRCGGPYGPPLPFGRSPAGLSDTFCRSRVLCVFPHGHPGERVREPALADRLPRRLDRPARHLLSLGGRASAPPERYWRYWENTPLLARHAVDAVESAFRDAVDQRCSSTFTGVAFSGGSTRRALPQRRTRLAGVERHIG